MSEWLVCELEVTNPQGVSLSGVRVTLLSSGGNTFYSDDFSYSPSLLDIAKYPYPTTRVSGVTDINGVFKIVFLISIPMVVFLDNKSYGSYLLEDKVKIRVVK